MLIGAQVPTTLVRQIILKRIMPKNVKLCYANVRFQLATTEKYVVTIRFYIFVSKIQFCFYFLATLKTLERQQFPVGCFINFHAPALQKPLAAAALLASMINVCNPQLLQCKANYNVSSYFLLFLLETLKHENNVAYCKLPKIKSN